jgi:hypothetical protein
MARLAIRMPLVHREPHIIVLKHPVPADIQLPRPRRRRSRAGRREERVPAFRTEKVLLVIRPLPKRRVVQANKALLNNGSFARVAPRSEVLYPRGFVNNNNKSDPS